MKIFLHTKKINFMFLFFYMQNYCMDIENINIDKAFHRAVRNDFTSPQEIIDLIKRGANPNKHDGNNNTPIYLVAQSNSRDTKIKILLNAGADPRVITNDNRTIFHRICYPDEKNLNSCKLVIEHIKTKEEEKKSLLKIAETVLLSNMRNNKNKKTYFPKPIIFLILNKINPTLQIPLQQEGYLTLKKLLEVRQDFIYCSDIHKKTAYEITEHEIAVCMENRTKKAGYIKIALEMLDLLNPSNY